MRVNIIRHSDIVRCPIGSLAPSHYRDDGSCLCVDPQANRAGDPPVERADDTPGSTVPKGGLERGRCRHCGQEVHNEPAPDGAACWVDETGGDVCGWDGGNEPHEPEAADA